MTTTSKPAAAPPPGLHQHGHELQAFGRVRRTGETTAWLVAEHLVDTALVRADDGR
ncbi:MAG TPA: hypothetical protein VGH76_18895 [Actinomycetospora sp.]|jgi:hypothetical protein|uniref:hypothetical protein n=1 Tax=Actinomycetospora sp. TaxID=1872135 RepID=UPI002F4229C4